MYVCMSFSLYMCRHMYIYIHLYMYIRTCNTTIPYHIPYCTSCTIPSHNKPYCTMLRINGLRKPALLHQRCAKTPPTLHERITKKQALLQHCCTNAAPKQHRRTNPARPFYCCCFTLLRDRCRSAEEEGAGKRLGREKANAAAAAAVLCHGQHVLRQHRSLTLPTLLLLLLLMLLLLL